MSAYEEIDEAALNTLIAEGVDVPTAFIASQITPAHHDSKFSAFKFAVFCGAGIVLLLLLLF